MLYGGVRYIYQYRCGRKCESRLAADGFTVWRVGSCLQLFDKVSTSRHDVDNVAELDCEVPIFTTGN